MVPELTIRKTSPDEFSRCESYWACCAGCCSVSCGETHPGESRLPCWTAACSKSSSLLLPWPSSGRQPVTMCVFNRSGWAQHLQSLRWKRKGLPRGSLHAETTSSCTENGPEGRTRGRPRLKLWSSAKSSAKVWSMHLKGWRTVLGLWILRANSRQPQTHWARSFWSTSSASAWKREWRNVSWPAKWPSSSPPCSGWTGFGLCLGLTSKSNSRSPCRFYSWLSSPAAVAEDAAGKPCWQTSASKTGAGLSSWRSSATWWDGTAWACSSCSMCQGSPRPSKESC